MTRAPVISFRLAPELVKRLDAYVVQLAQDTGLRVSRNAAAAKLLSDALNAAERRKTSRAPRR